MLGILEVYPNASVCGPNMLDNLSQRLSRVVKTLRGHARLTEDNIQEALREVRLALLEADVALPVVKDFIAGVKEKAVGQEVISSLTPGQAVQLAMALAQFSGASSGADAFEKMRKALGVDALDVDVGAAGGPTVGVSRYIAKGVSVGVRTGVKPDQTSVNVGVDVFKNFRVQSETRVDGKTSVGVGVEWEY